LGTAIDISSETNLTGDTEIVLTGDTLSIAASIARDSELHSAVTLSGQTYLSLVGQALTASQINLASHVTGTLPVGNGGTGATSLNDLITLGTHTAGSYISTITGNTQIVVGGVGAENATATLSIGADSIGDTQLEFNTGQNLTTTSSPTFAGLTLNGNQTLNGNLAIREGGATPTNYTTFVGGVQSADVTYTLPTGAPASNGYVLTSATDGTMSWQSVSGTGGTTGTGATNQVAYWTGTSSLAGENQLNVSRGGTGINGSTAANGRLLIGNGTGYTLANLTSSDSSIVITNGAGSINLASSLGTSIDISSETNLTGDTEIVLTGNSLSIAASIARDSELHSAVTLSGQTYLSLVGQALTASQINLASHVTGTLPVGNGGTGATSLNDLITLSTHTVGSYISTITGNTQIVVGGVGAENATATLSIGADSIGDTQLAFNTGQHLTTLSSPTFAGLTLNGNQTVNGTLAIREGGGTPTNYTTFVGGVQSADVTYTLPVAGGNDGEVLKTDASGNLYWALVAGGTGGIGTVTSVGSGNGLTGGPITGSGTLSINLLSTDTDSATASSYSGMEFVGGQLSLIRGCGANEVMGWDNTNGVWKCTSVSGTGGTTGSGLAGHIPYWSSASNLTYDSNGDFFWDVANNRLGIGTTSPVTALDVNGTITTTGLTLNGNQTLNGTLAIREGGGTPTNYTTFVGGVQSADVTYTLPTGAPSSNGYFLSAQTDGTLAWQSISGAGGMNSFSLSADTGTTQTINDTETISILGGTNLASTIDASNNITLNLDSTLTGVTWNGNDIDISDYTNLSGDTEIVLTGDSLSIASSIARDSELHSEVTLSGESYLSRVGQALTANQINLASHVTGTLPIANGGTGATTLNDLITLGTHTAGNYINTITGNTQIVVGGVGAENATATLAIGADSIGDTQLEFNTGQNLTTTSTPTFGGLTISGNQTITGTLGIRESAGATFYTYFQGADQTGNVTYTLPSGAPVADNYVLTSATDGTLAWQSSGAVGAVNGNGAANQVAYWTGAGTIAGENQLNVSRGGTGVNASAIADGQLLIGNDTANNYTLATLTPGDGINITNGAGSITVASTLGTSIDISSETNLAGDSEIVLDSDSLYIAASIARDSELHDSMTLSGESYLSRVGQALTANQINLASHVTGTLPIANGGTGAVTLDNLITLGTHTTGSYVNTITGNTQIVVGGVGAENATATLAIGADSIGDTQLEFNTGQNLTSTSSPTFAGLTLNGNQAITGTLGIRESAGATFYTYFQGADQTGNVTYTLPSGAPAGSNYVLTAQMDGTMSWSSVSGVGGMNSFSLSADTGTTQTINDTETISILGGTNLASTIDASNNITLNLDSTLTGVTWNGNDIDISDYTNLAVDGSGEIVLTGDTLSIAASIARDSELHSAVTLGTANGLSLSTQELSLALASTTATGALSNTDWNTFNNKFNLPALTSGSVLFSNGTTIAQDNTNLFWDDTNKRLGIGTATPTATLQLVDGGRLRMVNGNIDFTNNGYTRIQGSTSEYLGMFTNDTERIRIDNLGNVGIGDTTPASLFTVGNGDLFQINTSGQVVAGAWNGTNIGATYGGTGINTSTSTGIPTISSGTWSVQSSLPVTLGGTGLTSYGTANQIMGMNAAGNALEYKTVSGTANQITVTNAANSLTLSLPQDIATTSSPSFAGVTLSGLTAGSIPFIGTGGVVSQDNLNLSWNDASNYLYLGSAFSFGIDATDSNKFKIYSGSGIAGTSEFSIDQNGVTSIANLELGELAFDDDSGAISWIDMGVTSGAVDNTIESYTAQLDGNPMLTIYGLSDGLGGVDNLGVGIGTVIPTAKLHIAAGVATAGGAPLKLTSGVNLTTAETGAFEYDGSELYFTPSGTTRETVAYMSDITAAAHNPVTLTNSPATYDYLTITDQAITLNQINLATDITGTLSVGNGGTGLTAYGTANQIMGMNAAGDALEYKTVSGTANQITVTNAANSLTLSLPQDIHTAATPTFGGLTLSNLTPGSIAFAGTGGVISQDNPNFFWDDTNNRLGLGTAAPTYQLDIAGAAGVTDLFRISSNGSDIMTVTDTQTTFSNPVSFGSVGDVSMAYDLIMANSTSANIEFNGTGYIFTNSPSQNLNLNLSAANDGQVIVADTLLNDLDLSTATAGNYYGTNIDVDSTGIFTADTTNIYGINSNVTSSGISTGGIVNTYGGYFSATGENTGAATTNAYGLYVNGATGADNNYSAAFMNGNVGIGTAAPTEALHISGGNILLDNTYSLKWSSGPQITGGSSMTIDGGANVLNFRGNSMNHTFISVGGNWGLGDATPESRMEISANGGATDLFMLSSDDDLNGDLFVVKNSGYVGIGDTTPASLFTVGTNDAFQINASGQVVAGTWMGSAIGAAYGGTGINTSASTGVPTINAGTWSVNPNLAVTLGGTGTNTQFTPGSIVFAGTSGVYTEDNTKFFWDDTNNRLGLGTATPTYQLDIAGAAGITDLFRITSNGSDVLTITDSQTTFSNPVAFGSVGDVSMAYDLVMGNSTSANLIFNGSGYVKTDSAWQNLDLTLSAANDGYVVAADTLLNDVDLSTVTAGSYYGTNVDVDSTGIFTTGTTNIYGINSNATSSGISTGGTVNTYGGYFQATGENTGAATTNAYGLYVNGATGADNNYSAAFMNGNVGIGTATPTYNLEIADDSSELYSFYANKSNGNTDSSVIRASGTSNTTGVRSSAVGGWALRGDHAGTASGGALQLYSGSITSSVLAYFTQASSVFSGDALVMNMGRGGGSFTGNFINLQVNDSSLFTINASGQVVAGTWMGATIGVGYGGTGTSTAFTTGSIPFAGAGGVYTQDNSNFFWDNSTKRLGIGTNTPGSMLDLFGANNQLRFSYDISNYATLSADNTGALVMSGSGASGSKITIGSGLAEDSLAIFDGNAQDFHLGLDDTDDIFKIGLGGALGTTDFLSMDANGRIGIGTVAQTALLHLNGTEGVVGLEINSNQTTSTNNIMMLRSDVASADDAVFRVQANGAVYADGAYTGTGADYAEYFFTKNKDLVAGETVCIDEENNNAIKRCSRSGDTNIMGIVSSNPSVIGNGQDDRENDENYKVIGMLGQIPARVNDENGAIKIGDGLAAANMPGYLRKAEAGESTVGIALEKLVSGDSTIQVMISRRNKSLTVETVEQSIQDRIANMEIEDQVNQIIANGAEMLEVRSSLASLELAVTGNGLLVTDIQIQMNQIKEQIREIDFVEMNDKLDTLLSFLDASDGNVKIDGKLEVAITETGALVIKNIDLEAPTIGTGKICGLIADTKDENGNYDNIDDCSGNKIPYDKDGDQMNDWTNNTEPMPKDENHDWIDDDTHEPIINNGKKVIVPTKAVSKNSKIFVTSTSAAIIQPLAVVDIKEGESFTIETNDGIEVDSALEFNWWIVEEGKE